MYQRKLEGHSLPVGIWTRGFRREMEFQNNLCAGGKKGFAIQRTAERDGQYYGCGIGNRSERPDCK